MTADYMVDIDVAKLAALVAKTPFSLGKFENLVGWSLGQGSAPLSKRRLAWDILCLPKENLETLKALQDQFPLMSVSSVREIDNILSGNDMIVGVNLKKPT